MNRHAARLVDDQQMPVLEDHGGLDQFQQARRRPTGICEQLDAHRREAHFVAGAEPVFGVDAFAVDPHFPFAQQAIDTAARHGLEMPHEEIVYSLPGFRIADGMDHEGTSRAVLYRCRRRSVAVHGGFLLTY
jgi:hypothetical protein